MIHKITLPAYLIKHAKIISILITVILSRCGDVPVDEPPPPHKEYSFCTYDVDGICVIGDSRFIDIDLNILSWSLSITEKYVNLFYPGLNLSALSEQENLKLHYRWADIRSKYTGIKGTYTNTATVYLRDGENITDRMKCIDRYFITAHEILHFITNKHIEYDYTDPHMIPNIFNLWEHNQSIIEDRAHDYTNIAEGLIYNDISNECGY